MPTHIASTIRRRRRLAAIARDAGYDSVDDCLRAMYVEKGMDVQKIARMLGIGLNTLRGLLSSCGIALRSEGGPHNVKVVMTPELYAEIQRDGVPAVAARMGVNDTTLRWQLAKLKDGGVPMKDAAIKQTASTVEQIALNPPPPAVEQQTAAANPEQTKDQPTDLPPLRSVRLRGF